MSPRVCASLLAVLLAFHYHALIFAQTRVDPSAPEESTSRATSPDVNAADCTNGAGKTHTLRCALRSLDRLPGGRWLKWAIGAVLLIWIPYRTTQHVIGFYSWLRAKDPTDDRNR